MTGGTEAVWETSIEMAQNRLAGFRVFKDVWEVFDTSAEWAYKERVFAIVLGKDIDESLAKLRKMKRME